MPLDTRRRVAKESVKESAKAKALALGFVAWFLATATIFRHETRALVRRAS